MQDTIPRRILLLPRCTRFEMNKKINFLRQYYFNTKNNWTFDNQIH